MIVVRAYGGPEVLRLEERPTPDPGPGQVRVRVEAAGVNFVDIYQRIGYYRRPLPFELGEEGAGTVEALGAGVDEVAVGDRVAWTHVPGSYATHALVPAIRLVALPGGIATQEAAAVLLQGMTAHYLATSIRPLRPGDSCLVLAAAGGVGLLLCQILKRQGVRVIGVTSSAAKAELARSAGADEVVVSTGRDFQPEVERITGGEGVTVAYDSVGADTWEQSLRCLAVRGHLVLYGQSSGPVPPIDPQLLSSAGSITLTRPSLAHYTSERKELEQRAGDLFDRMLRGNLSVRIDRTFPLAEAAAAHHALASRQTSGKLLLLPERDGRA